MRLNKTYKLTQFVNKPLSTPARYTLAFLSVIPAILVTGSIAMTRVLVRDFLHREPKLAFRRAGWLVRQGWLNKTLIDDPFFNFTEDLSQAELHDIQSFLARKKANQPLNQQISDALFLQAALIHLKIKAQIDAPLIEHDIQVFYDTADKLLAQLDPVSMEQPLPQAQNERGDDFDCDNALTALKDFAATLNPEQFQWYVVSGTLLGLHREGAFLKHDYDIDLGIHFQPEVYNQLLSKLKDSTFIISKRISYIEVSKTSEQGNYLNELPAIIKLIHPNGISIDLFIHHQDGNVLWHGSSIHRWENTFFDLKKVNFLGLDVFIPSNPDQYLTENYGDWRTPVKTFDCSTGTPNLTIVKNFLSFALVLKRLAVFNKKDPNHFNKLHATLINQGVITERFNRNMLNDHNHE